MFTYLSGISGHLSIPAITLRLRLSAPQTNSLSTRRGPWLQYVSKGTTVHNTFPSSHVATQTKRASPQSGCEGKLSSLRAQHPVCT